MCRISEYFEQIRASEYDELPPLVRMGIAHINLMLSAEHVGRALRHDGDVTAPEWPRALHEHGSAGVVGLSDGGRALLRLSVVWRPAPGARRPYLIGAALKRFWDEGPSVNAVFASALDGVDAIDLLGPMLSNRPAHPSPVFGDGEPIVDPTVPMRAAAEEALDRAGRCPGADAYSLPAAHVFERAPQEGPELARVELHPTRAALEAWGRTTGDFRVRAKALAVGLALFEVHIDGTPRTTLTLQTPLLASFWGDRRLYFPHPH